MSKLPKVFKELEKYVEVWDKDSFAERYEARANSEYEDVEEFYNSVFARIDDIMTYIDQFEFSSMPSEVKSLTNIAMAFMDVTPAVELFFQTTVPHGFDYKRVTVVDDSLRFQK